MANTKSAKKALRQNERRRRANLLRNKSARSAIKEFQRLRESGKKEEARAALQKAYAKIDKLAKSRAIHKNKAARLKSRHAKTLA